MAEGMADSVSKQKMLDVAANYELSLLKNRLRAIEWQKRVVALTSEVKRRDVRSDNEDRPLPGRR